MKVLAIVGKVDSRVLAYPLARALSLTGMTALVTYDGAYRRLYFGEEDTGTVSGVDIKVGANVNDDLINGLNDSGIKYDNIIVVTSGFIPENTTGAIICSGIDKSILAEQKEENKENIEDNIELPEKIPSKSVCISFESTTEKGITTINLKDTAIKYIYSCEERKELRVIDDKRLNKLIVKIASIPLDIQENELLKLLTRKEYLKGKK